LFTNHSEIIELVDIYVFWLLPILGLISIAFVLEAYFLVLTEGEIVRNVSFISFVIGFVPTIFTAYYLHNNYILWLALCLFLAARIVSFGVQLPRTFKINIEDDSLPALE
jgi:MATE family multidrug resistance protein